MKVLRILCGTVVVLSIICTSIFYVRGFSGENTLTEPDDYKGIITVWHVDSFEGGVGSRKQFLLKVARSFEKKHKGVLIMVVDQTPTSVKKNHENGQFPDLISYGNGVQIKNQSEIKVKSYGGGMVGGKTYATSWCRGGYALICNPNIVSDIPKAIDALLVSQAEYTQPLTAFCVEEYSAKTVEVLTPMDAYVKFVSGKTPYFLGTQRDVNRLITRGFDVKIQPLMRFNDLYQYISVTSVDIQKAFYANLFIEHLLSEQVQMQIGDIGMFSVNAKVEYSNAHLLEMQNAEFDLTLSAFADEYTLKEMQSLALSVALGEKEGLNKIKNVLI